MRKLSLFIAVALVSSGITSLHPKPEQSDNPNDSLLALIQGEYDGNNAKQDIKATIDSGANVNMQDDTGKTILHIASENGDMNVVKYLVRNGADITIADNKDQTAPYLAANNGHKNIVWFFIKTFEIAEDIRNDLSELAAWQNHKTEWQLSIGQKISFLPGSEKVSSFVSTPISYVLLPIYPVSYEEPTPEELEAILAI